MYEFAIIWDWLAFAVRWLHVIAGMIVMMCVSRHKFNELQDTLKFSDQELRIASR